MSTIGKSLTREHPSSKDDSENIQLDEEQLKAHRELLQKEIDKIAGLLQRKEIQATQIDVLDNSEEGGAPSNTPVQSPKKYSHSSSNYITDRPKGRIKPLKLKSVFLHDLADNNRILPVSRESSKFLSLNDLLTSDNNDSIANHTSPLGDKTLDFINQTTMTANGTLYQTHSNNEPFESIRRHEAAESSTVVPLDVLEDRKSTKSKTKTTSFATTNSSPVKARFDGSISDYASLFLTRNIKKDIIYPNPDTTRQGHSNMMDDEISKNILALSSSPMTKFETKFPEPRPLHELFDSVPVDYHLREDDDDDDNKTNSAPESEDEEETIQQDNDPFQSDNIDVELKQSDKNPEVTSSPQHPQFEVSNSIKGALRKRKPISYDMDNYTIEESPKASRRKRRDTRMKKLQSSSPNKRGSSSGSNKSSYQRRKRSILPRSKSGCWTCRIRKKKCTEEKPSCSQCVKLGLECDGYSDDRPDFMMNAQLQRRRLDDIKHHTSQRKKIGVKKVRIED